jgi:hypothetical protein
MAWFYRHDAKELNPEDAKVYERAEIAAKEEQAGLWRDPAPPPPWLFRRGERGAALKAPGGKPATPAIGPIIGSRASKIYHLPNCPDYSKVLGRNRILFKSDFEAEASGYRKARNCPR